MKKPAIRPLRARYNPEAPYVIERRDDEDGSIRYEIWDKRPETYNRLCVISEDNEDCDEPQDRGRAKKDAELIVRALNAQHTSSVEAALASIPDQHYWLLAKGRLRPTEPLYAIQLLKPGTEHVIAEAEGDSIPECVAEALARSKAQGG